MEKTHLSANGTLNPQVHAPDELEVTIDGRSLSSHSSHLNVETQRDSSIVYILKAIEPQQDGTCIARYIRDDFYTH